MSIVQLQTSERLLENKYKLEQVSEHPKLLSSDNGKSSSKKDLYLKPNKELLEEYGWKEEYNYYGVKFRAPLKVFNLIFLTAIHLAAVYAVYFIYSKRHTAHFWKDFAWGVCVGGTGGFGITAGVHRFWTHKSFKANLPMRIVLAVCYSIAGQNPIPAWVLDHRVHHKYSETDADPHNANRGFFFSHVGWLMMKKHPAVLDKGKSVDMSDVLEDPVVQFHTKYYVFMQIFFCFILPTLVPVYFWNESWALAFLGPGILRYVLSLNFTWNTNSIAHFYGNKPYDSRMMSVENRLVSFLANGEGWHNYHHAFPWDYKASELPYNFNVTTFWLDVFAKIGWVWDRKTASDSLIKSTSLKHGDGTHLDWGHGEIPEHFDENGFKKNR